MNELALAKDTGEIVDFNSGGSAQMAAMLADMEEKLKLVQKFFGKVMQKDVDYGKIPGTDKPALLKPGAEKLLALYNFSSVVKEKVETRDLKTGYYQAQLTMQIVHRGTGQIVAEGVGEASSYESKYRYRWAFESDVPDNVDKSVLQRKTFKRKGDGSEYYKYRLENPDMIDQWNTVLKMAKKRALVDATLSATGTSGIFTQSEDDMEAWIEGEGDREKDKYEKQRNTPKASDEKSSFTPPATNGQISEAQKGKIIGDASRKGINANGIKAIVKHVKNKEIEELTKQEASGVIKWLGEVEQEELQELLLTVDVPFEGGELA